MANTSPAQGDLREWVGRLLLFGWQDAADGGSRTVNSHACRLIDDLAVGGVILMGRNIGPPAELRSITAEMQRRNAAAGRSPLFIAVDQEGGRVSRLAPPNYPARPTAREIGATGWTGKARMTAASIGEELVSVGINWDFAPVLDVNNNPKNPVIGDRSYGDDPHLVASMGVAATLGFQEDAGLLACGKHFPGHGDTDIDSHLALPVVPHDRARLEKLELVPFRAAIDAGLAAVMTAHIMFPTVNPDSPATLSHAILSGILRDDLGFDGLIITDCLEMAGVAAHWGSSEAAVRAVEAGADILLCCHTWETQLAIGDALCAAVRSGRLTEERIEKSATRIEAAKKSGYDMPHKVCPRCGAQFASLKSATCPQCFARLEEVDEETAAEMAAARAEIERSPEYQAAKADEDEQFRHQSFQACLGAVGLAVAVVVFACVMIAMKRHVRQGSIAHAQVSRPVAKDPLPIQVGAFERKQEQQTPLSGTLSVIYHATYYQAPNAAGDIDVYAISLTRSAADQNEFRNFARNMAHMESRRIVEAASDGYVYEIEEPAAGPSPHDVLTAFLKDWAAQADRP